MCRVILIAIQCQLWGLISDGMTFLVKRTDVENKYSSHKRKLMVHRPNFKWNIPKNESGGSQSHKSLLIRFERTTYLSMTSHFKIVWFISRLAVHFADMSHRLSPMLTAHFRNSNTLNLWHSCTVLWRQVFDLRSASLTDKCRFSVDFVICSTKMNYLTCSKVW